MNKPRRWFQLHLSTMIALTLTAGFVLYLNLSERMYSYEVTFGQFESKAYRGFPFRIPVSDPYSQNYTWSYTLDTCVAASAIIVVYLICEYLTALRKRVPRE